MTDLVATVMGDTGVSKSELAGRLGVSKSRVTRLLMGDVTFRMLAKALYVMGYRVDATAVPIETKQGHE